MRRGRKSRKPLIFIFLILFITGCQSLAPSPTTTPVPPTKTNTPIPTDTPRPSPTAKSTSTATTTFTITPTFTKTLTPTPAVRLGEWKGNGPSFRINFEVFVQEGKLMIKVTDYNWEQKCGNSFYQLYFTTKQNISMTIEQDTFSYEDEWLEIQGELITPENIEGTLTLTEKFNGPCIKSVDWKAIWVGGTPTP